MQPLADLFAPAYLKGNAQSEAAVQSWLDKRYPVTAANIDQTKDAAGVVDPLALKAMAQGGAYDVDARRNSIAAQVQANQAAQATAPAAGGNPQWAALRAQMSPSDIATFQRSVSPAEFSAFMSAGASTPMAGGAGASMAGGGASSGQGVQPLPGQNWYGGPMASS
jgi:hypothetical protein